ncbi:ATP-grasp domain-containing protein [Thalassoglobus sp. JC818]|uniref:ATP-grasp domain-containing protein n=1 Tax=Thalassoglobus sp. JC818 TaxID=3232136 RepID=UPI00345B33D7
MIEPTADFILIGASTRAAAFSALRSGLRPDCLDLFADSDLAKYAHVERVDHYPHDLIKRLKDRPQLPVVYVGGLENYPEMLDEISESHTLWGNDSSVVRRARDPKELAEAVRLAQVKLPEWRPSSDPPERNGEWILKPTRRSGGSGIISWTDDAQNSETLNEEHRFERFISGKSYSGIYIAGASTGDVRFVGLTHQLHGEPAANAHDFQWCGNIGPVTLSVELEHKMRRVGNLLKWKLGIVGIFGIDFIVTDDEDVYVLEVNPRYPASLDLLEFATCQGLFGLHVKCFDNSVETADWTFQSENEYFGKMVVYAPREMSSNGELDGQVCDFNDYPEFGDIPRAGVKFLAGEPFCTVYAKGGSLESCRDELNARVAELNRRLA